MMQEPINVFWTGGLDSTYLIVRLCLNEGGKIQPYYIIDEGRHSVTKELEAIRRITDIIRSSKKVKSQLLDAIIVEKRSIDNYPDITEAWNALNKKYKLGSQYDWLSRFARQKKLKLMVGVQMEPRGKVVHTLEGKSMEILEFGGIEVYSTNGVHGLNRDASLIYKNILFPKCIVGISKVQEWEELHQWGFGDVAKLTWFCHNPVLGMTCGHCNPCKDALHEGMAFRVSQLGHFCGTCRFILFTVPFLTIKYIIKFLRFSNE